MNSNTDLRRRQFLLASAAGVAAGMAGWNPESLAQAANGRSLPPYADWKDAKDVIVHSANTIETRRSAFGTSVITPEDLLFVRNNLSPPDPSIVANPGAWQVTIEGVRRPRTLTLADMKRMGLQAVAMVLQCSGNGRGFFEHKASGTQWTVGAAGCTIWSGVPVSTLVEDMGGIADGLHYMTGTGGEVIPAGIDPKTVAVERSVPIKAMETALLAWEMNGAPLPLAHGGPLRLVVPGFYGVNNIKYIKRLAFTAEQTQANIQASGYRVRPIGVKGNPDQPTMWKMNVKSWINYPLDSDEPLRAGLVQINGVAFSGSEPVTRVDVSVDGGSSWRAARFFGPDLGPNAWRQFVLPVRLARGTYLLASRALDAAGHTQPEARVENERGYGNNGWRDHAVQVTVT